jgi:hypothetical protein
MKREATLKPVRTPTTLGRVPNKPRSQHRSVRFNDEDWAELDAATKAMGTDRGTVLKELARWYMRRPGAKLPARPTREMVQALRDETDGGGTSV